MVVVVFVMTMLNVCVDVCGWVGGVWVGRWCVYMWVGR